MRKKTHPLFLFNLLSFLFFIFSGSLKASDANKEIIEEIKSYLLSNSHYPILKNTEYCSFEITNLSQESSTIYASVIFKENPLSAVFSVEKNWLINTTNMLYMCTDIEASPSAKLFNDICLSIQAYSGLLNKLSDYHVLIKKSELTDEEIVDYSSYIRDSDICSQIWTFYNFKEWIEFRVFTESIPSAGFILFAHNKILSSCEKSNPIVLIRGSSNLNSEPQSEYEVEEEDWECDCPCDCCH